jgi:hypothetical protein
VPERIEEYHETPQNIQTMARFGLQTFWIQKECQQLYSDIWCNDVMLVVVMTITNLTTYPRQVSNISKNVTSVLGEMIKFDIVVFNHHKILF